MGLSAALGGTFVKTSYAASRKRLTILSSIGLDTLHPYAHSSSPQCGIWNNMVEPLVEVNYAQRDYFGVLAQSWDFQGKIWVFKLRKNIRFHDGAPFTAQDVCQVIADQLAKAGIKTELVSQEFVIFWGKDGVNGGKMPLLLRRPSGGGCGYRPRYPPAPPRIKFFP